MRSWMIGMVIGIFAIAYTPLLPGHGLLLALSISLLVFRWLASNRGCVPGSRAYSFHQPIRIPVGLNNILLGIFLGLLWATYHAHLTLQAHFPEVCNRQALTITGEITSLPRRTAIAAQLPRQRFEFVPDGPLPHECGQPRKLLLSYYGEQNLEARQRWQFSVALRRPWGLSNPGSFNIQSWFALSGIDAVGNVRSGGETQLAVASGYGSLHHSLRARVSSRIQALGVSEPVSAVLRAITVADKGGIDIALWQMFQQYGVNHLLVISGLHIGLAASIGYLLGNLVSRFGVLLGGLSRLKFGPLRIFLGSLTVAPQLLAFAVAAAYAALAGFSLSTQRALVMLACFCLASALGRPSSGFNNLLLAAVVLLGLNPLAVIGSGFWLSFGAVAALLWLVQWQRGISRGRTVFQTHGYMALVMLPLGGLWFGGASWASAAANFVAIPLLGLWVVPAALGGAVLTLLGSHYDTLLWQLAAWPLERLMNPAISLAEKVQFYWPVSSQPGTIPLAIAALVGLVLPVRRRYKLLLLLLLTPLVLPLQAGVKGPRLIALDVGQGTAVVFTDGQQAMLYDTGGGDPAGANIAHSVVLPYLRSQGIRHLDTLVISHGDTDHSAGLETVLKHLAVDELRFGSGLAVTPAGQPCRAGQSWQWRSGVRFRFLSPLADSADTGSFESTNDNSCVLMIDLGNARILLAGDIGSERERSLVRYWGGELRSDVLLVAHHGSRTSTTGAWLNSVRPQVAILSSGYASRFGHPHPVVVDRLQGRGITLHYTALEGALELSFSSDPKPTVRSHREGLKPWWM